MSYEPYNHMTVRPFKDDELMHNEYCDGNHCGDPTILIIGAMSLNYFENN